MRGFPKSFATKQDYLNCLPLYPEETKLALRSLYADRFKWGNPKELKEGDEGVVDVDHLVSSEEREVEGEIVFVRIQYERIEDENAAYIRLGFSEDEILNLINGK